jgi:hypothetical protein
LKISTTKGLIVPLDVEAVRRWAERSIAHAHEWFDQEPGAPAMGRILKQPPKSDAPVASTFF